MKKRNIIRVLSLAVLFFTAAGCTGNFEDLNTNKSNVTEDQMKTDDLDVGSQFAEIQRNVYPLRDPAKGWGYEIYQIQQSLCGDVFAGYVTGANNWYTGANNMTYALAPDWCRWTFNIAYPYVMQPWKNIKDLTAEERPHVFAMATVLKVAGMHRVTDCYGPIPYSTFEEGGLYIAYQPQKDVYYEMIADLDMAIEELTKFVVGDASATALERFDYIYGGNVSKWVKYANSLKLRLAMRMSNVSDPAVHDDARRFAEEAVSHTIGVFTEVADGAFLGHEKLDYVHPLYHIVNNYGGEHKMCASMESFMNGYNDPRRANLFTKNSEGNYVGMRVGIDLMNSAATYMTSPLISLPSTGANDPIQWMSAPEVYFLRAEGALRGWNMSGTAQDLYEDGIRKSFEQVGVTGVDGYITNKTATPVGHTDPVTSGNSIAPTTDITIAWDDTATFDKNLERILTQKWIAVYPDGIEGWSEFRRTGYPKIFPVAVNNSGGTINTNIQVRRLLFSKEEHSTNAANVGKAIQMLGGPDNGGTRLWWDTGSNLPN